MPSIFQALSNRKTLLILTLAAAGALLGLAAGSAVTEINPDGISYISIAQHYADGHWKEAVNAYWSPMLSWLLIPFVAAGVSGEAAFRIIAVIVALAILIVGRGIVGRYAKDKRLGCVIYYLSVTPFLLFAVGYVITPDLLVVLWMLTFLAILTNKDGRLETRKRSLVLLGLFCGIGFLIKSLLLPFSILSLSVWYLFLAKAPKNMRLRSRVKLLLIPLATLSFVVAAWAVPLSLKYDHPTIGAAARYSMSFIGPNTIGHPITNGLIPPPNAVAVTPWEDPTGHTIVEWGPFDSLDDFGYYLDYVLTKNVRDVLATLNGLSPFIAGVLWALTILLVLGKVDSRHRAPLVLISLLSSVLILAYCLNQIVGGGRYVWPVLMFSIISVSILLGNWQVYAPAFKSYRWLWLGSLTFPLLMFASWYGRLLPPSENHISTSVRELAKQVDEKTEPRARFAASSFSVSALVSYYANLSGYGSTQPGLHIDDPAVRNALKQNEIKYYLYVENPNRPIDRTKVNVLLTTDLEYSNTTIGLPLGTYKAHLVRLR